MFAELAFSVADFTVFWHLLVYSFPLLHLVYLVVLHSTDCGE